MKPVANRPSNQQDGKRPLPNKKRALIGACGAPLEVESARLEILHSSASQPRIAQMDGTDHCRLARAATLILHGPKRPHKNDLSMVYGYMVYTTWYAKLRILETGVSGIPRFAGGTRART